MRCRVSFTVKIRSFFVAVVTVASGVTGCGGATSTGTDRHIDVRVDASVGDASSGSGGASSGGSGGSAGGSSGSTCAPSALPSCSRDGWPYCAPDFTTAVAWFPECDAGMLGPYLARCGAYMAVVTPGKDTSDYFFYDVRKDVIGILVGHEGFANSPEVGCQSFDPSFLIAPDVASCVPLAGKCASDAGLAPPDARDAGTKMPCPGSAGPSMVRVPAPDGTTYCIDSTEVTNSQYMEFLHSKGSGPSGGSDTSGQDPQCSWNTAYEPQASICAAQFDAYARPDYPMVCIDWCDAFAFCKWAGKHLCGKIGGGGNSYLDYANATTSQWFNACSKGGTLVYPYGNTFDANACNGAPVSLNRTVVVGSMPKCEGGYQGLFDLSGNVWEWEDSCEGASGSGDVCRVRGGSVNDFNQGLSCGSDYADPRSVAGGGLGFRCCGE